MNLLELFAGSRSVGSEAEKQGLNVFSVDWTAYANIDLSIDIGELKKEDVPFVPDVVWADRGPPFPYPGPLMRHSSKSKA